MSTLTRGPSHRHAQYLNSTDYGTSTSNQLTIMSSRRARSPSLGREVLPYGTPVTFNATVSAGTGFTGTPTGSVTFFDGTTAISGAIPLSGVAGNDTASYTTSPGTQLSVGTHSITALYSGDSTFGQSVNSPALSVAVLAAGTTTTLTSPTLPSSVTFGTPVMLKATVSSTVSRTDARGDGDVL